MIDEIVLDAVRTQRFYLFTDDAVLQRDIPVPVWGWATPGDFGPLIMPLNEALNFVATESFFWTGA